MVSVSIKNLKNVVLTVKFVRLKTKSTHKKKFLWDFSVDYLVKLLYIYMYVIFLVYIAFTTLNFFYDPQHKIQSFFIFYVIDKCSFL